MTAVLAVAKTDWRRRRRAWLSVALIASLGAGAVMAAALGARRTDSAYTRFVRAQRGADIVIEPNFGEDFAKLDFDDVARLPQVAVAAHYVAAATVSGVILAAPIPPGGIDVDRPRVVKGRMPRSIGEGAVGFDVAEKRHINVGSRINLAVMPAVGDGAEDTEGAEPIPTTIRIVGIEAAPGEFPPQISSSNSYFIRVIPATIPSIDKALTTQAATLIRLRHGDADLAGFTAGLRALAGPKPQVTTIRRDQAGDVERSFHLQAIALWLVAALLALVTVAVVAQLLARESAIDSSDNGTLKAMGATRAQLWRAGMLRAAVAGMLAAIGAAIIAVAASPLWPIGSTRVAEPHPGITFDTTVISIGMLATVVFLVVAAAIPLWSAASVPASAATTSVDETGTPSAVGRLVGGLSLPPAASAGVRMALQRGRGRTAVPVVSSLLSVVIAIAALAAALTFGANLNHLLATPRLYGWNWDAHVTPNGEDTDAAALVQAIGADPAIEAMAEVDTPPLGSQNVAFDSSAFEQVKGTIDPVILEGRAPRGANEIALGTETMRRLHTRVGATIDIRITAIQAPSQPAHVVGRIVVAPQSNVGRLGTGAFIDMSTEPKLVTPDIQIPPPSDLVIRFAPGVDKRVAVAALQRRLGPTITVVRPLRPADLVNFGRVQNLPLLLGALIAVLAALTLAHTLVTSIRRRRRDLAMLKTLGFSSRQVWAAIAAQATVFVATAVVIGLPIGVIAGRIAWRLFADRLGTIPDVIMPSLALLLVIPGAILVANLIAFVPGAIAGRLRPALVLRTE